MQNLLTHPTYDPNEFLDAMKARLDMSTDKQLANFLGICRVNFSHIRHKRRPISSAVLVVLHEATGLPVRELRALMGVQA